MNWHINKNSKCASNKTRKQKLQLNNLVFTNNNTIIIFHF